MAARALVLLLAVAAVPAVGGALPLDLGDLAGMSPDRLPPVPSPPPVPAPFGSPLDATPGGPGPQPPMAPDLVAPDGSPEAALLVGLAGVGLAGLAGFAVWGGTRFRPEGKVLAHDVRARIYQHVQEHVGANLKEITEHLGLSTTNAVWHLRKLEETGLVKGRKFNGAKVYYPTAGGVQARNLSIAGAALTNENARTILGFVAAHPGVHQREVARLLNVNHGTVRWHLKKLRRAELLEERRTGGSASYHSTSLGEQALRTVAARAPAPAPAAPPAGMASGSQAAPPARGQA